MLGQIRTIFIGGRGHMKKKIRIVFVIWLIVAIILPLGIMTLICGRLKTSFFTNSTKPEVSQELYELFLSDKENQLLDYPIFESPSEVDNSMIQDSSTMKMRIIGSDNVYDLGYGVSIYSTYVNTAQSGDINVSSGTWGVITKFDDIDNVNTLCNSVALWNVDEFIERGNGDSVRAFLKETDEDVYIKVDSCYIINFIAYPVRISLYTFDDNEFLRTFYCYNPNDFEGNELITRDDLILTSQYDYIFEMVERKSKLIDKFTKNLQERIEYNDEPFCKEAHIVTPFGVLDYIVNSENGYGGVHVDYLDAKNLLIKYFLPVMIVFTIIAFSVIGVIKSKERRGRL